MNVGIVLQIGWLTVVLIFGIATLRGKLDEIIELLRRGSGQ